MLPRVNGSTESYLADLDRIQSNLDTIQRQVSSGIRVGLASDDPSAVPGILEAQSQIAADQQSQTNLNLVKADLQTGDGALQQAVTLVEQAISLGARGANLAPPDPQYSVLEKQVQSIQEQLVQISATSANGRYIFSGDLEGQALYTLDNTQPTGVRQLAPARSTLVIADTDGTPLWKPITAQDIFDARNPDGTPAAGNVFAAVNSLVSAMQSQNDQAAQTAIGMLKSADEHLNLQLGLYGIAENRASDALDTASKSLTNEQQALSTDRDTDVASAAIQLSQLTLQQQAALSARAKISQLSLFDFLA